MHPRTIAIFNACTLAAIVPTMDMLSGRIIHTHQPEAIIMRASDTTAKTDEQQILDHIHSIFGAYLAQDRQTIRDTHTEDWRGFTGPAEQMIRGIGSYMEYVDRVLGNTNPIGYELLDTDIRVHGDVAVVFYLARYSFSFTAQGERTVHLRSADIYEKRDGDWIQTGSNICNVPSDVIANTAYPRQMGDAEREELLGAREEVWRAWFDNDAQALRRLVPEETIAIDAGTQEWANLDEIVARSSAFAQSGATLIRLEFPQTQIQAFGPVAIIYTTYEFEIESAAGERRASSGRATEIFVKREGEWLNPGWHLDSGWVRVCP